MPPFHAHIQTPRSNPCVLCRRPGMNVSLPKTNNVLPFLCRSKQHLSEPSMPHLCPFKPRALTLHCFACPKPSQTLSAASRACLLEVCRPPSGTATSLPKTAIFSAMLPPFSMLAAPLLLLLLLQPLLLFNQSVPATFHLLKISVATPRLNMGIINGNQALWRAAVSGFTSPGPPGRAACKDAARCKGACQPPERRAGLQTHVPTLCATREALLQAFFCLSSNRPRAMVPRSIAQAARCPSRRPTSIF